MILTIDFNPILKRKYTFDGLNTKGKNIPTKMEYGAAGHGIETAYLLNALNTEVKVSGYLGGVNGTYIQYNLTQLKIPNSFIPIKDETPDEIILSSSQEKMMIEGREPRITREELENFYDLFNKMVIDVDIICFLGKIPSSVPKEIIYDFINTAKKFNIQVFINLKGEELRYTIDTEPCLLLMNREDLEEITNLKINTSGEVVKASRYLLERGVKKLVINLENNGSILFTQDCFYRVKILSEHKIFTTNLSYMIGGYAFSISRRYDMEMTAKLGQACGICNSYIQEDIKDMGDIKYIMNEIEVKRYEY